MTVDGKEGAVSIYGLSSFLPRASCASNFSGPDVLSSQIPAAAFSYIFLQKCPWTCCTNEYLTKFPQDIPQQLRPEGQRASVQISPGLRGHKVKSAVDRLAVTKSLVSRLTYHGLLGDVHLHAHRLRGLSRDVPGPASCHILCL